MAMLINDIKAANLAIPFSENARIMITGTRKMPIILLIRKITKT
jgi:hypothetical protein